jgi:hypothetical protein
MCRAMFDRIGCPKTNSCLQRLSGLGGRNFESFKEENVGNVQPRGLNHLVEKKFE